MKMNLNWTSNDYFSLLLHRDKRAHAALEMLVDDLHVDKERTIGRFLCHSGSEDFLWGLVRLLGNGNSRVAGNAAYILGTLAESELGCYRVIALTNSRDAESMRILPDLTKMLTFDDSESVMNAAGTMGTLAESNEGRAWMLSEACLKDTFTNVTKLLSNQNLWTASNAALVLARLSIAEEGCEQILAHDNSDHILTQLVVSLGVDEAGRGMNAAFAIGRLCDMEQGRTRLLTLPESEKMITSLALMLCCNDTGASKNACFALSCLATNKEGHTRLLKNNHSEDVLRTLSELLSSEDTETGWFAAMTLRTLASQPRGCLRLRENPSVIPALKEIHSKDDVTGDLRDEVEQTLEILKRFDKPDAPQIETSENGEVLVTWDEVTTKSGFIVRYQLFEGSKCLYSGRDLSYIMANPEPFTQYSFRLRVYTDGDESPYSEATVILTEETVPGAPTNLRVLGCTTTQLKVGWDPPEKCNGVLKGYYVYNGKTQIDYTPELCSIISGLQPSTMYEIQVCAANSKGKGPKECLISTTSELGAHAPSKPEVIVRGRNELHVTWRAPEVPLGRISRYDLSMNGDVIYSGMELHFTVHRLKPDTDYVFMVTAITTEGRCESKPCKKRTAKDEYEGDRAPLYQAPSKKDEMNDPTRPSAAVLNKKRRSFSSGDGPRPRSAISRTTSASSVQQMKDTKQASQGGDHSVHDGRLSPTNAVRATAGRKMSDSSKHKGRSSSARCKIKLVQLFSFEHTLSLGTKDKTEAVSNVASTSNKRQESSSKTSTSPPSETQDNAVSLSDTNTKNLKARVLSGKSKASRVSDRPESEMSLARSVTSMSSSRSRPQAAPIRGAYKRLTRSFEPESSSRHRTSVNNPMNYSSTERLSEPRSGATYGRTANDGQMPFIGVEALTSPRVQNVASNIRSRNNYAVLNKVDPNKENYDDEEIDSVSQAGDRKEFKSSNAAAAKKSDHHDLARTLTSFPLSQFRPQPTGVNQRLRSGLIDFDAPLPSNRASMPNVTLQRANTFMSSHRPGMKRHLDKIAGPKLEIGPGTHQWAPDFPGSGVERNHNKFVPMQFRTQPAHIPGGFQRQATNLALFEGGAPNLRLDLVSRNTSVPHGASRTSDGPEGYTAEEMNSAPASANIAHTPATIIVSKHQGVPSNSQLAHSKREAIASRAHQTAGRGNGLMKTLPFSSISTDSSKLQSAR